MNATGRRLVTVLMVGAETQHRWPTQREWSGGHTSRQEDDQEMDRERMRENKRAGLRMCQNGDAKQEQERWSDHKGMKTLGWGSKDSGGSLGETKVTDGACVRTRRARVREKM